jgi:hypothetical protein
MSYESLELNPGTGGQEVEVDRIGGVDTQIVKVAFGAEGTSTKVSTSDPLPVTVSGVATASKQDTGNTSLASILTKLSADPATNTTLASILAKIIAAPATEAKQDTGNTSLGTIAGKDFATQTTLASILAKIIASPATEATLASLLTELQAKADLTETQPVSAVALPLPSNASIETGGNLAAIAAKDFATQTTLASVLAKLIVAPATEAKQDTGNTSLASILAKIIAAPSTEAKQDTQITAEQSINTNQGAIADAAATAGSTGSVSAKLRLMTSQLASIQAAVEIIDNFISGSKGLVTEDNSAAIKTSVELIDNAISGAGFNITQQGGVAVSLNTGVRDTGTQRVTIATNDLVPVSDNSGSLTVDAPLATPVNVQIGNATLAAGVIDETGSGAVDALAVGGGTAHDAVDSGNPQKMGAKAVSHGSNPAAVAAADRTNLYANVAGIPFYLGGHPNIISAEYYTTGAQTDDNILPTIAGGTIYVITGITVIASAANTVQVSVRIGFGASTVPAQGASGADAVAKVILSHPNIPAGSGFVKGNSGGIVGIGGDGEELRITCSAPTTGSLIVQVDYFTIPS